MLKATTSRAPHLPSFPSGALYPFGGVLRYGEEFSAKGVGIFGRRRFADNADGRFGVGRSYVNPAVGPIEADAVEFVYLSLPGGFP